MNIAPKWADVIDQLVTWAMRRGKSPAIVDAREYAWRELRRMAKTLDEINERQKGKCDE